MGSYTITTTADDDIVLNWALKKHNNDNGQDLVLQDYVQAKIDEEIGKHKVHRLREFNEKVARVVNCMSPTDQEALATTLKMDI